MNSKEQLDTRTEKTIEQNNQEGISASRQIHAQIVDDLEAELSKQKKSAPKSKANVARPKTAKPSKSKSKSPVAVRAHVYVKKSPKNVSPKNIGAKRPSSKSKSPVSRSLVDPIKRALVDQVKQKQHNITPAEAAEAKAALIDLEKEFGENLARIYNKGAHKSGVNMCHKLIDQNCDSQEVVGIFLRQLANKNMLVIAKAASAGSF